MPIGAPYPESLVRGTGGELDAGERAIHDVLHDWFMALQDSTVAYRQPDPGYVRPAGKEPWTEADLEQLVCAIDGYVMLQMGWANLHTKQAPRDGGPPYTDGPGYGRLTGAQRLAFAQALEQACEAHPLPPPTPPPGSPSYTSTPGEAEWAE